MNHYHRIVDYWVLDADHPVIHSHTMVVSARPVMAEPIEEEISNMNNIDERPLSPSEQMASQDTPEVGVKVVEEMSEEDSQVEIKAEESLEDVNIEATIEEESAPKVIDEPIDEKAEETVHHRLESIQHLKKRKPEMIFGVLGCMAQNLKDDLLVKIPLHIF